MNEIMFKTTRALMEEMRRLDDISNIPTGFQWLDEFMSGLGLGKVILLAGRPRIGTTSLALNIALNAAKIEREVVYIGLNESADRITKKLLAIESGVNIHLIEEGNLEGERWNAVSRAKERLLLYPMLFMNSPYIKTSHIVDELHASSECWGTQLLVIDKLDLLLYNSRKEDRSLKASNILSEFKLLAKELNVVVMIVSGLKRTVEYRKDHVPYMSDLAGDDYIEESADKIMLLHRDDYYDPFCNHIDIADVIVAKNKTGSDGIAELLWNNGTLRFKDKN